MGREQSKLEQLAGEQFDGEVALNKEFGLYDPEQPGKEDVARLPMSMPQPECSLLNSRLAK